LCLAIWLLAGSRLAQATGDCWCEGLFSLAIGRWQVDGERFLDQMCSVT